MIKPPFFLATILKTTTLVSLLLLIPSLLLFLLISSTGVAYSQQQQEEEAAADSSSSPQLKDTALELDLVVSGLNFPTSLAFLDNNTMLVTEKNNGQVIVVFPSNGTVKQGPPAIDVPVNSHRERGLLGIATWQDKPSNTTTNDNITTYVFLYFTESNGEDPIRNMVYRYEWNSHNHTLGNATMLLNLPADAAGNHNGGKLKVDDAGHLYAVIGDQNRDGQLQNNATGPAPDDTSVIFRVWAKNGSAPADNPFFNNSDEKLRKYYAYGMRNSFGIEFDPATGILWDIENGPDRYDEMNIVEPGFNSGWKVMMGSQSAADSMMHPNGQGRSNNATEQLVYFKGSKYRDPVFSWQDSTGLTDIEFLNSSRLGDSYANNIFVGDINNGNMYYFQVNENRTGVVVENNSNMTSGLADLVVADSEQELSQIVFGTGFDGGITDIETGPDGYLYILTLNGDLYRVVAASENLMLTK